MAHGGKRPGAGRLKGSRNRESKSQTKSLAHQAKAYTTKALNALLDVAVNGKSESARVSACIALLDRGHGRPRPMPEVGPSPEDLLRAFALEICENAESMPIATQQKQEAKKDE